MIAFVIENRRVRFDINQSAAEGAGLKLSSQLLSVARSVRKIESGGARLNMRYFSRQTDQAKAGDHHHGDH